MNELLTALSAALSGSSLLGVGAAAGLGAASVLLSPCHLASVPLVVAVVQARDPATHGAAAVALRFGLGVIASFAVVGAATVALGRIAGDLGPVATWGASFLLIVFGLETLQVIHVPWVRPATSHPAVRGAHPTIIGFLFGATLGPCTFAFMAPALGAAFALAPTRPAYASVLLGTFLLAHAAVLVVAGLSGEHVVRFLGSRGADRTIGALRKGLGALLVVGGVFVLATGR